MFNIKCQVLIYGTFSLPLSIAHYLNHDVSSDSGHGIGFMSGRLNHIIIYLHGSIIGFTGLNNYATQVGSINNW